MKETLKRLARVAIGTAALCAVCFALAASLVLGYTPNAETNQLSWVRGWNELFAIFGGIGSFFALSALLLSVGLAVWLLARGHLTYYDQRGKNWRLWLNMGATMLAAILVAVFLYNGVMGTNVWIHISGTGWIVLGLLAIIGVFLVAMLIGWWEFNAHMARKSRFGEPTSPREEGAEIDA